MNNNFVHEKFSLPPIFLLLSSIQPYEKIFFSFIVLYYLKLVSHITRSIIKKKKLTHFLHTNYD